jgi:Zn-dependent M16 (insulinase) family peptidase
MAHIYYISPPSFVSRVVYSEMKGAYSDPEDKLERLTQSLLFPDNPYFYDSGGDPAIIPVRSLNFF